jgi:hypothetical protein
LFDLEASGARGEGPACAASPAVRGRGRADRQRRRPPAPGAPNPPGVIVLG